MILDQTEGSGSHINLVVSILERTGLVKGAAAKEDGPVVFADDVNKLWPIGNPGQILESGVSIALQKVAMTKQRYNRVENALIKAARSFNIYPQLQQAFDQVRNETMQAVKQANYTSECALPDVGDFPIGNPDEVARSAEAFCLTRDNYPLPWRKQAATNILYAAQRKNVKIATDTKAKLESSAGYGIGLLHRVGRALFMRGEKVASITPNLGKQLVEAGIKIATFEPTNLIQIKKAMESAASLMDMVDDKYNLRIYYGDSLDMPEDVAFSVTQSKVASVQDSLLVVGREGFDKDELRNLPAVSFSMMLKDTEKVASAGSSYLDPDKLVKEATANKISSSTVCKVLRGFGIKSIPINLNSPVDSDGVDTEVRGWQRFSDAIKIGPQGDDWATSFTLR